MMVVMPVVLGHIMKKLADSGFKGPISERS